MRKILLVTFILLFCVAKSNAQSVYFPSEEGVTLEYVNKNAKDKVTGYIAYKFQNVDFQDDLNFTVKYQMLMMDGKRKETMSPIDATVKVVNGTVYMDAASALGNIVENFEIKGNGLVIPSDVIAGQKLDDISASLGTVVTSTCTNVTVTGEEQLTTDAGTFDTVRIDMDMSGKALFIKFEGTSTQWYAKGIGHVRTISYDKKGKVSSSMELVKLSR